MTLAERKRLIADTVSVLTKRGLPIVGARIFANGDVLVLTESPAGALDSSDDGDDWVNLAGKA